MALLDWKGYYYHYDYEPHSVSARRATHPNLASCICVPAAKFGNLNAALGNYWVVVVMVEEKKFNPFFLN